MTAIGGVRIVFGALLNGASVHPLALNAAEPLHRALPIDAVARRPQPAPYRQLPLTSILAHASNTLMMAPKSLEPSPIAAHAL